MKRILILEPDEHFATSLFETLTALGDYAVSSTPTLREACLIVAQQAQDLAFIPVREDDSVLRSLRTLQPTLRLVALLPEAGAPLPDFYANAVQTVLPKPRMRQELQAVLAEALTEVAPAGQVRVEWPTRADVTTLDSALQQAILDGRVLTALLARREELLAHSGTLTEEQAENVLARVNETWQEANSAQIQFIRLPSRSGDLLLYTRPVATGYLLTLAAQPDAPVGQLRQRADGLAARLTELVGGEPAARTLAGPVTTSRSARLEGSESPFYALVWQPRQPLPPMLHAPLQQALQRTAAANACVLTHVQIESDLVHVVIICPPGRSTAWAAHIFKQGVEREIAAQYGVEARLWTRGYYAAETANPLSAAELDLFLDRRR